MSFQGFIQKQALFMRAAIGALMAFFAFNSLSEAQAFEPANNQLRTQIQTSSLAPSATRKKTTLKWNLGLSGSSYGNEKEQAQTTGFGIGADLRYVIIDELEIKAAGRLSLESGYAQSRFGENTPKSGFGLKEAFVQYRPIRQLIFQAGAINQEHLESEILVSDQAFPALTQRLRHSSREFEVELKTQQAIPTSTTLSTKAADAETSPTFMTETLTLKVRPMNGPVMAKAFGTHFSYKNLPSSVAFESSVLGNDIANPSPSLSRFRHGFDGWLAGGKLKYDFARGTSAAFSGQMIQNTNAPESYKNGQMMAAELDLALPKDIDLQPKAFVFFAESDVAPAYYNSSELGHNNRQGWGAKLTATFKALEFKTAMAYVNADVINKSPYQTRQQSIFISFETLYDAL